jgi:membrane-bound serine protease (ClpP class)
MGAAPSTGDVVQAFTILGASLVITAAVVYGWLRHIPSSNRFGGLFLRNGMAQAEGYISAAPRIDLIGKDGVALTDLRPAGTATIAGERVDVVTEGEYLSQGSAVRVVRSEGYRHVVQGIA